MRRMRGLGLSVTLMISASPLGLAVKYTMRESGAPRVSRRISRSRTTGSHGETLDIMRAFFPVAVDNVVDGTFVVLLEDISMSMFLPTRNFLSATGVMI